MTWFSIKFQQGVEMKNKNKTIEEMYAFYVSGYTPNCGYTLEDWFKVQEYFRKNPGDHQKMRNRMIPKGSTTNG